MITLWFSCYLADVIGMNHYVWWGFPYFMTFLFIAAIECTAELFYILGKL